MTAFHQDLSEPAPSARGGFWESTRHPPQLPPAASPDGPRPSAASLAGAVTELMEMIVRKRVPRIETFRVRLQIAEGHAELEELEAALHALHAAASAVDVLAAREGGAATLALEPQCVAIGACANRLWTSGGAVLARHTVDTPVVRLVWIDLMLEAEALDKRVRQGVQWLSEMEEDLQARRQAATAEVTQRALQEIGRRGQALHQRLQRVHSLCANARTVHSECERLVQHRGSLCQTLREKVGPGTTRLQEALRPFATSTGEPLTAPELVAVIDARHELQVALTQAAAEVIRLQACEHDVAAQLAWLGQKAGGLT